jgi:radical SAM protein with 4Fe4S-binding SPASM domain
MISLTKMLTGKATVSQALTYEGDESFLPRRLKDLRKRLTVVVLNLTARCNLNCIHCYASVGSSENELRTEEVEKLVDELSEMKVPVLLISGGEPLLRSDIFEIASYAAKKGIRCSLSTNGTLITEDVAYELKKAGFEYVGVSIDGLQKTNDFFRGKEGAFERALEGLINARDAGLLTGIRFTVTRYNLRDVEGVLNLAIENEIPRFCLYHLVPSGRAEFGDDISNFERRILIDWLMGKSIELVEEGYEIEILTVDNPADAIYAFLKLKNDPEKSGKVLEFIRFRGGDGSGERIASVDMLGNVHANQFWWDHSCGNVRERSFKEIWLNPSDKLLIDLRRKFELIKGRKCGFCNFKELCGGFRLRAMRAGDLWGDDPACYLRREEIVS